ncbi:hypothetical protein [Mesobacillus zeae]|uniref:hypothetical protein n=1 Tax=Mesobacillus zeae TaxID=1917180 RepID=UPI0028702C43|nr:hypothetical protein [Mesobacillus zeae]
MEIFAVMFLLHTDLSLPELVMLFTAAGQVQVSQIVDPLMTARFFVLNQILQVYGIKLFD